MKPETRARRAAYARTRRAEWERARAERKPWPKDPAEQEARHKAARTALRAKLKLRRVDAPPDPRVALPSGSDEGGPTQ